jgi:hypothetical protein
MTRRRSLVLCLLAILPALATTLPIPVRADDDSKKVTIRCDKNKTINDALAQHQGSPLTVEIIGTCLEHVTVSRSDVKLVAGAPGAAIQGTRTDLDTLTVKADRFVLDGLVPDGLSVSGGRNAIVVTGASQAQLRNCTAHASGSGIVGGIGILFSQGATGSVDACRSSLNPVDGIFLDGSIVTITNSTLSGNGRNGVFVFGASYGRIGFTTAFVPAPNTISDNGGNGIHVTQNSQGLIYGNTLKGNGTNPNSPVGRFGVLVFHARADLPGGNTITGNFGPGILLNGSTAIIGDPGFGLPSANTISGNSTAGQTPFGPPAGISLALASAAVLRNATVQSNTGAGVLLLGRSTLSVVSSTVTGNSVNGVELGQDSLAIFQPNAPLANISSNAGTDLKCRDTQSTYTGSVANSFTTDCTKF